MIESCVLYTHIRDSHPPFSYIFIRVNAPNNWINWRFHVMTVGWPPIYHLLTMAQKMSMKTRISAPLPRDQENGNVPERPSLDPGHLGKEDAILWCLQDSALRGVRQDVRYPDATVHNAVHAIWSPNFGIWECLCHYTQCTSIYIHLYNLYSVHLRDLFIIHRRCIHVVFGHVQFPFCLVDPSGRCILGKRGKSIGVVQPIAVGASKSAAIAFARDSPTAEK